MVPSSDRICIHYILLEEENTMIIHIFLKANTKYYSVMHLSQKKVKLNIIHGRPHTGTVCPSSARGIRKNNNERKKKKRNNEKR